METSLTLFISLAAFHGTMYHVRVIVFSFQDIIFMGSTHVVYSKVFDNRVIL